jgi:hypothetical protein
MVELDLAEEWHIVLSSADPVAELAAHELQGVLQRVTGRRMAIGRQPRSNGATIVLAHEDGEGDGFTWQAGPGHVELHGRGPRGLLYAVYSFLEALGCWWVSPGAEGERLPRGTRFHLPDGPLSETPALPGRCLIVGHYAFMRDVEDWIVWAARNRLNTIFLHITGGSLAMGAAPEEQWQAHKEAAVALARQRGMVIEHGGHGLAALLPRRLFKRMPEAFRYHGGRRVRSHNLCPSSEEGLDVVRRSAEAHFRAHPEVDVFHLWPDDIPGGGWCECDRCQAYTPSEQSLLAINAVAEALQGIDPDAQISFLAYMDAEAVPSKVTPRRNVCLLWAPRSRCYAHATDDDGCPVNVSRYADVFRAQVAHFEPAGAQPARVFEYSLDALLFKSLLPPLLTVMQRDLWFYRNAGAHTVQALMTGDRPWITPQLNAWAFARLSWDPDQNLDALLADFCRATFGTDSANLPAYYRALEQAFALALDIVPEQVVFPLRLSLGQLIDDPVADMGDPVNAPPKILHQKRLANAAIEGLLREAADHLQAARATAFSEVWDAERSVFDLTRAWLRFDFARVRLYDAVASRPVAPHARRWFDEARSALREVLAWGDDHIADRRFRKNFQGLHRAFWGMRLDKVRRDHFSHPWLRWALVVKSLIQIAWTFVRMMGMYND